jgi:hypothetical protein
MEYSGHLLRCFLCWMTGLDCDPWQRIRNWRFEFTCPLKWPLAYDFEFLERESFTTSYNMQFTLWLSWNHMTISSPSNRIPSIKRKTKCGRAGCIILYTGDGCIFCEAALKTLNSVVSDFGLPTSAVSALEASECCDDLSPGFPGPMGLPTIRICDETLVGLPDPDEARGAVMHAVLRSCFQE